MCQMIWWNDPAKPQTVEIESLGQLRAILPAGAVIVGDPGPEGDECCLCPVDIPATFAAVGMECVPDNCMGFELKTIPPAPASPSTKDGEA